MKRRNAGFLPFSERILLHIKKYAVYPTLVSESLLFNNFKKCQRTNLWCSGWRYMASNLSLMNENTKRIRTIWIISQFVC